MYIIGEYCLPLVTLRGFPIRSSLGIPISQSLCALLSWVVVVFHPLGVYYPFCVYQRKVDLHLLIMRVSSSFSFVACKKLNLACGRTSPPLVLNKELSGFYWYLHSFGHNCCRTIGFSDMFVASKWIWQVICNMLQINDFLNMKFNVLSTWIWGRNVLNIPIDFLAFSWYLKSPHNAWKMSSLSILALNNSPWQLGAWGIDGNTVIPHIDPKFSVRGHWCMPRWWYRYVTK